MFLVIRMYKLCLSIVAKAALSGGFNNLSSPLWGRLAQGIKKATIGATIFLSRIELKRKLKGIE